MSLFEERPFIGAGGSALTWKIECDFLTPADWSTIAMVVAGSVEFPAVEGVSKGGLLFAEALRPYAHGGEGSLLIVDDILTTGGSMESHRGDRDAWGLVLFARGPLPHWIEAVWILGI